MRLAKSRGLGCSSTKVKGSFPPFPSLKSRESNYPNNVANVRISVKDSYIIFGSLSKMRSFKSATKMIVRMLLYYFLPVVLMFCYHIQHLTSIGWVRWIACPISHFTPGCFCSIQSRKFLRQNWNENSPYLQVISLFNFPLEIKDIINAFTSGDTSTATRNREASYLQSRPGATLNEKQLVYIHDTIVWKVLCM